jgi:hypothetical protein
MNDTAIVSFTEVPGLGDTIAVGGKILLLILTIDLIRETTKMLRGTSADFVGVLVRGVAAATIIAVIPWASLQIADIVLGISKHLFEKGNVAMLDDSFKAAFGNFTCDVSGWEAIGLFFSKAGLLLLLAQAVLLVVLVMKMFIIDVMWPIMFCLVVYLGVITVPLSAMTELGGLWHYVRRVLAVAMWPITFGFLMVLIAATFPKTIEAVASKSVKVSCESIEGTAEAAGEHGGFAKGRKMAVHAAVADDKKTDDFKGLMKYLAMCLGVVLLTWKTPQISSMMLGQDGSGGIAGDLVGTFKQAVAPRGKGGGGKKGK